MKGVLRGIIIALPGVGPLGMGNAGWNSGLPRMTCAGDGLWASPGSCQGGRMEQPAPAAPATNRALPCEHPPAHQKKNHGLCFPFSFILLELCFPRKSVVLLLLLNPRAQLLHEMYQKQKQTQL